MNTSDKDSEKRKRRREQTRLASQRMREKKKDILKAVRAEYQAAKDVKHDLQNKIEQLKRLSDSLTFTLSEHQPRCLFNTQPSWHTLGGAAMISITAAPPVDDTAFAYIAAGTENNTEDVGTESTTAHAFPTQELQADLSYLSNISAASNTLETSYPSRMTYPAILSIHGPGKQQATPNATATETRTMQKTAASTPADPQDDNLSKATQPHQASTLASQWPQKKLVQRWLLQAEQNTDDHNVCAFTAPVQANRHHSESTGRHSPPSYAEFFANELTAEARHRGHKQSKNQQKTAANTCHGPRKEAGC